MMINGLTFKLFIIAFLVFIITDMVWLGLLTKHLYVQSYAPWLRLVQGQLKPLWWAALMVYVLLSLGVIAFVMPLSQTSPYWGAIYGAILGAISYGIYDFTCLAVFKNFPVGMGIFDWIWGIVICSWSSFVTIYLGQYLK